MNSTRRLGIIAFLFVFAITPAVFASEPEEVDPNPGILSEPEEVDPNPGFKSRTVADVFERMLERWRTLWGWVAVAS